MSHWQMKAVQVLEQPSSNCFQKRKIRLFYSGKTEFLSFSFSPLLEVAKENFI
jgi:hypothetical protein